MSVGKKYLYKKLVEESNELFESESIEELADVQEVIDAIANEYGITLEELGKACKRKSEERGSFKEGIVLIKVEEQ